MLAASQLLYALVCNNMPGDTLGRENMLEASDSFEGAYRTHSGGIYRFLFGRTRDIQTSEDLTSTTFQKAWASRRTFKGGSERAWLYRIARNTLFDYWRKNKDIASDNIGELQANEAMSVADKLDKQLELKQLQIALARLPAGMRKIVQLRFIEGLPSKRVAAMLGIKDGNVRAIQYRALKQLREYLDE